MALYQVVVSILVFFGILGWFSIPIGVTISIIASNALGIGVDDTIHFIAHYNRNLQDLKDEKAAVQKILRQVEIPMVYTTFTLATWFRHFRDFRHEFSGSSRYSDGLYTLHLSSHRPKSTAVHPGSNQTHYSPGLS